LNKIKSCGATIIERNFVQNLALIVPLLIMSKQNKTVNDLEVDIFSHDFLAAVRMGGSE
jgi:hypothetical protein